MTPNKKVLFTFVSFFLVMVTIACSCSSLIPSVGGITPAISSGSGTPHANGSATPTFTPAVVQLEPPFIEQVASQISVPAGKRGTAIAACPPGSLMLSGGFASGEGIGITQTMPDPTGWIVSGFNSSAGELSLTAYTYCLHNVPGTTRFVSADVLVSGAPRAKCDSGEILTGGGYAFASDSLDVYLSTPDGEPAPFAWSVMAHNHQDADQSLTAYAVCLAGSGLAASIARDQTNFAPGTGLLSFTLICPLGSVVSAGGYEGTGAYISRINAADAGVWEVQVSGKIYDDGSLDHAVCLTLP
jgi:hypothetical protein